MKKSWILILLIFGVVAGLGYVLWPLAFTVVPIEKVEAVKQSETFDAVSYVDGIWSSKIIPTLTEKSVDLSLILSKFKVGPDGKVPKDELVPVAKEYGLITVGEAHVYAVKGEGEIVSVDTSKSAGVAEIKLDGYDGPIRIFLYIGPRIPSDETSIRDGVGFINFGDFKDQTQYGKVASEINKRVVNEVLQPINKENLQGKKIKFYGAFTIRTFNLITIDLSQVNIVPIRIEFE
jgi:predicted lipoprotein